MIGMGGYDMVSNPVDLPRNNFLRKKARSKRAPAISNNFWNFA
jgi:hypothetical protein